MKHTGNVNYSGCRSFAVTVEAERMLLWAYTVKMSLQIIKVRIVPHNHIEVRVVHTEPDISPPYVCVLPFLS